MVYIIHRKLTSRTMHLRIDQSIIDIFKNNDSFLIHKFDAAQL